MNKGLTIALAALFALGGLASLSPTALAQSAETVVTDPAGDAAVYAGAGPANSASPPQPLPATVPETVGGPGDLTGFRVFGETATTISFELSVASFSRPNIWQPSKLYQYLCFTWSGTGDTYRFYFDMSFSNSPQTEANSYPDFQLGTFAKVTDCAPWDSSRGPAVAEVVSQLYSVEYKPEDNLIQWTVPRKLFEQLNPENSATGALDPRPLAGDTLSGVKAYAVSQVATAYASYDETDAGEFTFQLATGNDQVKVVVPNNVQATVGVGGFDTPIYGVEIGSYQTVPVTIENYLSTPIEPNITVTILAGEPGKWEVRTLPSIPVPKMVGETPGRATVTLIVNSDLTVSHKESVRLLVSALDQSQPDHLGAQAVDIVAVAPPSTGSSTLYFHGTGEPCGTRNRWVNTLKTDAAATGAEMPFQSCDPQGGGIGALVTSGEVGYVFRPDVPFARDYTLSTTETAKASIVLRSVARAPGPQPQEAGVPMVGDVTVQLLSGSTIIGENTVKGVDIPGSATTIPVEVPIQGRILGGFGRLVPDDKGLGIRVAVATASRTIDIGGCVQGVCTPEDSEEVPSPSGKVYMSLDESNIVLPVASSERSGDIINITKSGALISLRLSEGEKHVFTNPGRIVVFNLTVRNEGVNVDTAKISAVLNQTGWKAEILPTTEYKLKVGQPRSFNVRVTAPANAVEGQTLLLELFATSTIDKNAVAKLPLEIEVTTGTQFEDQEIDEKLQQLEESKESPGFTAMALLVAALGFVGLVRRRRP